ncbi:MAG: T9SS type A sorting domain-containing protein [Candidatus Marinimicrobia bacterium]|nr:T9SS type A sorting domain-containing protein [Candidatus Neomarinimicrobiota bacterium]
MYKNLLSILLASVLTGGLIGAAKPAPQRASLNLKSYNAVHSTLAVKTPEYSLGRVNFSDREYDYLRTDLEGQIRLIGAPDLPSTSTLLAVPASGDIQAEISYRSITIESNVDIAPFQPVQLEAEISSETFARNSDVYDRDAWFPQSPVILHERVQMRDLTLVNVEVTPFQYNPVRKELRIYEGLEVNLSHSEPLTISDRPISRFFEPLYQALVPNSTLVLEENYQIPSILFIHTNNATVTALLQNLIDWRHEKGFEVHSVSTLVTGTSNSSIKSYIQTAYDTWENPPEFIVLVGDAGGTFNIPTWTESFSSYAGEGDLPYTHLAGTDYIADAFLGRIPFGSTSELTNIISKILNYEKNPSLVDTDWYTRALLVGDQASSGLSTIMTNRNINEYMEANGYQENFEVYSGSFVTQIANGINSGVSFFNYRGWLGMSGWDNADISALSNASKLPFVTILTCGTGSFTGDARSEKFLTVGTASVPKGAIGAVGTATSGTHTLYNNCVSVGIYHGIFSDRLYYAGAAVERGRLNLNQTYPTNSNNFVKIFSHWNNLMGDPATELWTGVPQELTVSSSTEIPEDAMYFTAEITDNFDNPVADCWVTLTGVDVFVSGYADSEGMVTLELPAVLPASIKLTASKHNFKPQQVDISVGNANFAVLVDASSLVETSGNSDGMLNPGESAQFELTFSNHSASAISNLSVSVTPEGGSPTEYLYATLDAGASVTLDDLNVAIALDYPGIASYDFVIDVDVDGTSYSDHRRFDVYAPYLEVNTLGDLGTPPFSFDPGEITDLVLHCENIGSLGSSNLTAVLRSTDPNVEITDSTASFSDATPGGYCDNASSAFELNINTQVTVGLQIPLQVEFTDDNGFVELRSILLPIGTPTAGDPTGPDAGGYFCYDSQDLAYALAPVYDWIEIVPGLGSVTGTLVPLNDNGNNQEDIETISLPFDFGFYGREYDQISICSNGYIALGESAVALFRNYPVPGPLGPNPMIAAFWDDLVMGSGDVYTYFNASEHFFVIEYHNMQNSYSNDTEKFEIILYDAEYYGSTDGNGDIKIQYHTINNNNTGSTSSSSHGQYSTIGLEDHTGQVGMQYTYNNSWAETAHVLTDNSALFFTTRTDAILPCPGWARGDINHDGYRGVQDLVILINFILQESTFGDCEFWAADKSLDSAVNVADVVLLVNEILGNGLGRISSESPGQADFIIEAGRLNLRSSQLAEAFSFTVRSATPPSIMSYPGLTVMSHDTEAGLNVLGYWSGAAPQEVELLRFASADVQVSNPVVAGAGGVLFKSAVIEIPESFKITSVYPNPFNPTVNISYSLPRAEEVSIQIYNALGQEVYSSKLNLQAGQHVFTWNGLDQHRLLVGSGIYFARITISDAHQMVKLTYLR